MTRKPAFDATIDDPIAGTHPPSGLTMVEWLAEQTGPKSAAVVRMSDVTTERIDWLWERWIPARMLTILGGHGGDGKSTVIASLIGALTTGGALPDGGTAQRTTVLMLSAEDDPARAIRPRLDAHGADPGRVLILRGTVRGDGVTRWFDLTRDVEVMRDVIRKHRVGLVVIDPLSSYLPKADRNDEGDVRDALQPLMGLIHQTDVGVVAVMHVSKSGDGRRASQRLLGSTAFTALARSVIMLADQPDDRQPDDVAENGKLKVLQVVKSNYSIPPTPQLFRRPLDAPIEWLGDSEIGIEECFAVPIRERGRHATERNDAVDFLTEILAAGPVPSSEILTQARAQGFSERTLRRAKMSLGIQAFRNSTGHWAWFFPDTPEPPESETPDPRRSVIT